MTTRRFHLIRVAAILAVTAVGVLGTATGAFAADADSAAPSQVVRFSADGIHWSDSYPGQLFQGVLIVPDASVTRSFYLRNAATEAANVVITLTDVTTNDTALADAMSVSSSTPGFPGATHLVTDAHPCLTLNSGLRLASAAIARVDMTVSLADLAGSIGQGHTVGFRLLVSLSSTDAGAPVPDTCPADDSGSVTVLPDPLIPADPTASPSDGTTTTTAPAAVVYRRTASGWMPVTSTGGGSVTVTPTTPTEPTAPTTPFVQTLVSNTARLYQEYDVAFWLAMSALGVLIVAVARRRRAEQPEAPEQYRQIGTDR